MTESPPVDITNGQEDYDVIVVGAGLSGLIAAKELLLRAPDLKILILEAKNRVGGRLLTIEMTGQHQQKVKFDLGGQWVGHTQTNILQVLKDLNLETYDQYTKGQHIAQMGISRPRPYTSTLPTTSFRHYGLFEVLDMVVNFGKMEWLRSRVNLLNVFSWSRAQRLDEMTVSKWAKENGWTRASLDSIDILTRSVYGVEANRLNMLFHLYYGQSAGSFQDLCEAIGDGAQAMKIQGGAQQICERLAVPFRKNKTLLMSKAVSQIDVHEHTMSATIHVYDNKVKNPADLTSYTARRVILAIPPNECAKIRFNPGLPSLKRRLFDSICQGNFIKFLITYQTAFWRDDGYSGEILSTGRTAEPGEILPIVVVYDGCNAQGTPALVGFIHEDYADRTKGERCNEVVKDLVRFLGEKALNEFIAYEEKIWANEEFNGGCPVSYVTPGQMEAFQSIREPYHSVHFAGTESATKWLGYMDGAVQAGRRAAHEVLHMLERDDVINYNYLTESVYATDYNRPIPPSNEYVEVRSPWWRRFFLASAIIFGIWAYSKKYDLSRTAKAIRPAEKAAIRWLFKSPWPSR